MAGRAAAGQVFATFSNLEMQHSPKIFCNFCQKALAKNKDTVTYYVKDYREEGKWKELTIPGVEFVRRFLMHVPPKRVVRIRHYGLLCTRSKNKHLTLCRNLLGCKKYISILKNMETPQILETLYGIKISVCKCCGGHLGKPQQRMRLRI